MSGKYNLQKHISAMPNCITFNTEIPILLLINFYCFQVPFSPKSPYVRHEFFHPACGMRTDIPSPEAMVLCARRGLSYGEKLPVLRPAAGDAALPLRSLPLPIPLLLLHLRLRFQPSAFPPSSQSHQLSACIPLWQARQTGCGSARFPQSSSTVENISR